MTHHTERSVPVEALDQIDTEEFERIEQEPRQYLFDELRRNLWRLHQREGLGEVYILGKAHAGSVHEEAMRLRSRIEEEVYEVECSMVEPTSGRILGGTCGLSIPIDHRSSSEIPRDELLQKIVLLSSGEHAKVISAERYRAFH